MPHPHSHRTGHPYEKPLDVRPNPDLDKAPFIVVWKTTQAYDLARRYYRASARPLRNPNELTMAGGIKPLDDVRKFGRAAFVFSGGDISKHPNIINLVRYDVKIGLHMATTPVTTSLASREQPQALKDAGLSRLTVSLDGPNATIHDESRRVKGSLAYGLRILHETREIGLTTQVNTVVRKASLGGMEAMYRFMTELEIVFWEIFFLIPMGWARKEDVASVEGFETVFNQLHDLSKTASFDIKMTTTPQYLRVVTQCKRAEARAGVDTDLDVLTSGMHHSQQDGIGRAHNISDGDGFMFIPHVGDICPSGFLPIRADNIRTDDTEEVYRYSLLFTILCDRSQPESKYGICSYCSLCGGSRTHTYAMTGDCLVEEPFYAHEPHRLRKPLPSRKSAD